MSSQSQARGSWPSTHWPGTLGALGCFAWACLSLFWTPVDPFVRAVPGWVAFAIYALIAIGIGSAARVTQSTAAWVALAAYLGFKILLPLDSAADSLLASEPLYSEQVLWLANSTLGCLLYSSLLVWSVRSLWRGHAVVARILSLALIAILVSSVASIYIRFDIQSLTAFFEFQEIVFVIQWAALGLIFLRIDRYAAKTPRNYAGMPRALPYVFVAAWAIFLIVGYAMAWEPPGTMPDSSPTPFPSGLFSNSVVVGLQSVLVAAVLWIVRLTGPGRIVPPAAPNEHEHDLGIAPATR
jgi:hypothetical protein